MSRIIYPTIEDMKSYSEYLLELIHKNHNECGISVLKRDNRTSIIVTPEFASLSLIISSRDSIKKTDATYELACDYLEHGMSEREFPVYCMGNKTFDGVDVAKVVA